MRKRERQRPWEVQSVDEAEMHEEPWVVSYADLVTLLFGFFVILYSFSSVDDKKFDQMSAKLAEAFEAQAPAQPDTAAAQLAHDAREQRAFQMLVGMLNLGDTSEHAMTRVEQAYAAAKSQESAQALLQRGAELQSSTPPQQGRSGEPAAPQTVELVLPDTTLFAAGSTRLTPAATRKLQVLAGDLRQVAELGELEVQGHTDGSGGQSDAASNFTISSLRAGAVASALLRFGVDPAKLSVRGLGNLRPLLPERDADGRALPANMAKNRRVSIVLHVKPAGRIDATPAH